MPKEFFPRRPDGKPTIYAYTDSRPDLQGLLKIGYTTIDVRARVGQQYPVLLPGPLPYRIVLEEAAMRSDGSHFTDRDVHRHLARSGFPNPVGEWFACTVDQVKAAILAVRDGKLETGSYSLDFGLRAEQQAAIDKTAAYFRHATQENPDKTPHFLWNAKMRFGKTFTAYQLAKTMQWSKILVLTFKPAVQSGWEEDLLSHKDFQGWQFVSPTSELTEESLDKSRPVVCFGSFQDYLGKNKSTGGIKTKNEWVHSTNWDCVIFDEYHYGAWRERARELFEAEDKREETFATGEGIAEFDEEILPITTRAYLYLSGTPFRALASGEFIEEQIFNWTYSDEQRAKEEWQGPDNPYVALPRMVLMTYQLPDSLREIASQGEFDEFDLNVFFSAKGSGASAQFVYVDEVQKWLNLIRGEFLGTSIDNLRMGATKPPMPFSDVRLLNVLSHTFWFLPSVASCHAMHHLLMQQQNKFFHDYEIIVAAGPEAGVGVAALSPVITAMGDPLTTKTITLSCGKLTTGVTVRPWTGIFMLRNLSTPETYFQAAFRVQSPWTIANPTDVAPNEVLVIKEECYVFDFAPDRALRQIADYSCRLNLDESNPEKRVAEFISFLPVLAYDGSGMTQIDAAGILDMVTRGTTATLLARRWESLLLVNVQDSTLQRLLDNPAAMRALASIEGFRNLNQEIETIINKSAAVKKAKREANDREISAKEKKELTEQEKEYKSKRKQIQEKLMKFATRVPIFMYLTDYRERSLQDVITQLEPSLFRKVTGLTILDFELLVSLGVFNSALMNDAVYKFKRYEDSSLSYLGIFRHDTREIGLFDTVLSSDDTFFENVPSSYAAN